MKVKFLYRTRRFTSLSTWVTRCCSFFLCAGALFFLGRQPFDYFDQVVLTIAGLACILIPVDDLAFNAESFFHFRSSVLSLFSKRRAFKIKNIREYLPDQQRRIQQQTEMVRSLTLEFIFEDDSSKSFVVHMRRSDALHIIQEIAKIKKIIHPKVKV